MSKLDVQKLIVHCSATRPDQDIGASEIDRWHKNKGWSEIGYHYVIKKDGVLEEGRSRLRAGAHARGFNYKSLGICLVGGLGSDGGIQEGVDSYTPAQMTTLRSLLRNLKMSHPKAEVLGHRDLPNVAKACPCFDVQQWFKE